MKRNRLYTTRKLNAKRTISHKKYSAILIAVSILAALITIPLIVSSILNNPLRTLKKEEEKVREINIEGINKQNDVDDVQPEEVVPPHIRLSTEGRNEYRVIKVVDGDTIDISVNGTATRIRLIGVNAPESVHPSKPQECFGIEASNYLKNKLNGKSVIVELDSSQGDTDYYGRLLAYVYIDGKMVNYSLIYDGYAYEYTFNIPYKYQKEFKKAQQDAEENNRGLWSPSACNGQL